MTSEIFTHQIVVTASSIDERNHVNNLAYLQWCMEAAELHWKKRATHIMQATYVWYVLRHEVDYRSAAFEGEELEVRTWVSLSEGVKSSREFQIFRKSDQKKLIDAKTIWCMLDAKTLKPAKISEEITNLFITNK